MANLQIKKIIHEHGMTIKEVSQKLGVSYNGFMRKIVNNLTISSLFSIADAIGCSPKDFIDDGKEVVESHVTEADIEKMKGAQIAITIHGGSEKVIVNTKDLIKVLTE